MSTPKSGPGILTPVPVTTAQGMPRALPTPPAARTASAGCSSGPNCSTWRTRFGRSSATTRASSRPRPEAVRPPDTSGLTAGATLAPMGGNVGTAFDAVRQRAFSPRGVDRGVTAPASAPLGGRCIGGRPKDVGASTRRVSRLPAQRLHSGAQGPGPQSVSGDHWPAKPRCSTGWRRRQQPRSARVAFGVPDEGVLGNGQLFGVGLHLLRQRDGRRNRLIAGSDLAVLVCAYCLKEDTNGYRITISKGW